MNGISDNWNDIQSQLFHGQSAHNDFLTEVYPANGMAYWLNADEEPLQPYPPQSRVDQPDIKVYSYHGNDMYPLSPPSPIPQAVPKSSSPTLYPTPSSCYTRSPLDGGNYFGSKDSSRSSLAAGAYCSPPFQSANNMNFNFPAAPFVSGLMIDDPYQFYDASVDARARLNCCGNEYSTTHIHPHFATNSSGIPPYHHNPPYRSNHDHIPSMGRHAYAGSPKVVSPPTKSLPSRSRNSSSSKMLECLPSRSRNSSSSKMLECTHEGCGKTFSMPHLLRNHLIWHSDARPFQCPHCKASFKRNCDMNRHIKSTHIHVSRRFVCQDCQMTWNRVDRYNSHMRTVHMGKKGGKPEPKHIEDITLLARYEMEGKFPTLI